jgi:hypothetical protein
VRAARRLIQCRPATLGHGALVTMDDAKVLQACRLLHEALCDDAGCAFPVFGDQPSRALGY